MANKIVNNRVDASIRTVQSTTVINPAGTSTRVNISKDPGIVTPTKKVVSSSSIINKAVEVSNTPLPNNVSIISIINSAVQNYINSYHGALGNAVHANVADVANSVAYVNVTGRPTLATVATSGSYSDLLNTPSLASYATQSYVTTAINNVVDGAPGALDTLKELAASLANNASYASSITTLLAGKANTTDLASYALTSSIPAAQIQSDWTQTNNAQKDYIKNKPALFSGSYVDLSNKPTIPADISDLTDNDSLLTGGSTDRLVNGDYSFILNVHGGVDTTNGSIGPTLAGEFGFGANTGANAVIKANGGFSTWTFRTDNTLQLPPGGDIVNSDGMSVLGGGGGADTGNITFSDTTLTSSNGNVKIHFSPSASPAVEFNFTSTGTLIVPGSITKDDSLYLTSSGDANSAAVIAQGSQGKVILRTDNGTTNKDWEFDTNGVLTLPDFGSINTTGIGGLGWDSSDGDNYNLVIQSDNSTKIQAGLPFKEWEFDKQGTLTVPSPTSTVFTLMFAESNYVPTESKPTLTLTDTPWELHGEYAYTTDGRVAPLALDSMFPTLVNPGYTSGDQFTFDESIHGFPGYTLTVTLIDVIQAGPAGWTANVEMNPPPVYPSTIKSLGAVKLTSNDNSLILGTDGNLTLPAGGVINNDGSDNTINIVGSNYVQLESNENYIWVEENDATIQVNGYGWVFHDNAVLELANGANISQTTDNEGQQTFNITPTETSDFEVITIDGNIRLQTANSDGGGTVTSTWTFDKDGKLTLPAGGDILDNTGTSVLGGSGGNPFNQNLNTNDSVEFANIDVDNIRQGWNNFTKTSGYQTIPNGTTSDIWIADSENITSAKFTVQFESIIGSETYYENFDTLTCEIVMAKKRFNGQWSAAPITVYGMVHTSDNPLVAFDSRIDGTTGKVILTCTPDASITNTSYLKVHSVEMQSATISYAQD